jgi:hypothetical protein
MIERLFDLVKRQSRPMNPHCPTDVPPRHDRKSLEPRSEISADSAQQNRRVRRLHGHMKRDTTSLVAATLRTGFLVGLAVILILVLFPAIAAQAAGSR